MAAGLAVVAAMSIAPRPVAAFSLFGITLFGGEEKPVPNPDSLPYSLNWTVSGTEAMRGRVEAVSLLRRGAAEPPEDAEALIERVRADLPRMVDALWGAGHYDAAVTIAVAGEPQHLGEEPNPAAIAAAASLRNLALVPIVVEIDTGPQFRLGRVEIVDASTGQSFPAERLPPAIVDLEPGDAATSAAILAAQTRIVDHFRSKSYPLAKAEAAEVVVIHPMRQVDLTLRIATGPVGGIGPVTISGEKTIDPRVIRSFVYVREGERYSPEAIAQLRRSVAQIDALSSARVATGDALDANGNIPLDLIVSERPPRAAGAFARASTLDGLSVSGYLAHRNLFGGAESLRLEASLFYLAEDEIVGSDFDPLGWGNVGGRVGASFIKPALAGSRNDLVIDATAERDRTVGYTSAFANARAGIRHRFSDRFSVTGRLLAERGESGDVLGTIDYTLLGIEAAFDLDTTDNLLSPTQGFRVRGGLTAAPVAFGSTVDFNQMVLAASTYVALDAAARYVLAARLGLGATIGPDFEDVPANRRFYAGGGQSVRGYAYQSISPEVDGDPVGGRNLIEGSLEARLRVTSTIGIVPFFDFGTAFDGGFPDLEDEMRYSAGLGLRYYTPIGPIRADVALPLNRQPGDDTWALYVGIGQAF